MSSAARPWIAALALGAGAAHGVDLDPQALLASRANAEANGVSGRLTLGERIEPGATPFEVVVANILAGALSELAPSICAALAPGGAIALSGILEAQAAEVMARYEPWCEELEVRARDGWVLVSGRRRTGAELGPPAGVPNDVARG